VKRFYAVPLVKLEKESRAYSLPERHIGRDNLGERATEGVARLGRYAAEEEVGDWTGVRREPEARVVEGRGDR